MSVTRKTLEKLITVTTLRINKGEISNQTLMGKDHSTEKVFNKKMFGNTGKNKTKK